MLKKFHQMPIFDKNFSYNFPIFSGLCNSTIASFHFIFPNLFKIFLECHSLKMGKFFII